MAKETRSYTSEQPPRFTDPMLPPALLKLQDRLYYPPGSFKPTYVPLNIEERKRDRKTDPSRLPVRTRDFLLPEEQELYDRAVTPEQQLQLDMILNRVPRMDKARREGFLVPADFIQTNLPHTTNIMERATHIEQNTSLSNSIDFSIVRFGAIPHDIVEGMGKNYDGRKKTKPKTSEDAEVNYEPKFYDVQPGEQSVRDLRVKRYEPIVMRNVVIPQIQDPKLREAMHALHERFQIRHPDDVDMLFLKFLDAEDGTISYAQAMFNRQAVDNPEAAELQRVHLWNTSHAFRDIAESVLVSLETKEERRQFQSIVRKDFYVLATLGYPEIVKSAYGKFEEAVA